MRKDRHLDTRAALGVTLRHRGKLGGGLASSLGQGGRHPVRHLSEKEGLTVENLRGEFSNKGEVSEWD